MDMQVHQLVMQHPEERERSHHQLLSLGMLTLWVLRKIFTLFFSYTVTMPMTSERRGLHLLASLQDGNAIWKRSRIALLKVNGSLLKVFPTSCSNHDLIAWNMLNANATNKPDDREDRDPLEYNGGEFDTDEPTEIFQAAWASKVKVSGRTGGVNIVHYLNDWGRLTT